MEGFEGRREGGKTERESSREEMKGRLEGKEGGGLKGREGGRVEGKRGKES